jgi:putative membrane protein
MVKPGILAAAIAAFAAAGVGLALPANANASRGDRAFVKQAAQSGQAEVMAAQLAIQRGIDANVRDFAQHMIRDHSKANRDLKQIASSKGIPVPSQIDPMDRAQIDKLRSLSGTDFDRAYSGFQVRDHRQAVALFQRESRMGRDSDLRQFAAQTLPTLRMHQSMSYQVVASLQPTPSLMAHRRHTRHMRRHHMR